MRPETPSVPVNRVVLFFVFTAVFSAAYQAGSMLEMSEENARAFMDEFEELVEGIDGTGIFLHNTMLALPMFLPGFGIAWGLFSATSTGYAFAAIVHLAPELGQIPPLAILYLSPFGLMELAAYSIAMSRSYILIAAIAKKTGLGTHAKHTAAEVGIVAGLLLAGGFLEYYMIEVATREGFAAAVPGL